jgi:hypothetical protein
MTMFFGVGEKERTTAKAKLRGFLDCAVHDEAVNSFGRNDDVFLGLGERPAKANANAEILSCAQNDGFLAV